MAINYKDVQITSEHRYKRYLNCADCLYGLPFYCPTGVFYICDEYMIGDEN